MKLIIITGLAESGKTTALRKLVDEDPSRIVSGGSPVSASRVRREVFEHGRKGTISVSVDECNEEQIQALIKVQPETFPNLIVYAAIELPEDILE